MSRVFVLLFFLLLITSCATIQLDKANFSWPVESELQVDINGNTGDERYSLEFNVENMFNNEFPDKNEQVYTPIRFIRNKMGYYFITSEGFKNVYVFSMKEGVFDLHKIIQISQIPFNSPAFNQRGDFIEFIYNEKSKLKINENGINGGQK